MFWPSASAGDPTEEDAAVGQVGRVDVGLEFAVVELLVGDQVAVAVVRDQDALFVDGPRGRALVADGPAVEVLSIEHRLPLVAHLIRQPLDPDVAEVDPFAAAREPDVPEPLLVAEQRLLFAVDVLDQMSVQTDPPL